MIEKRSGLIPFFLALGLIAAAIYFVSNSNDVDRHSVAADSSEAHASIKAATVSSENSQLPETRSTEKYESAANLNVLINDLKTRPGIQAGALEMAQAKAWEECGSLIARPDSVAMQIAQIKNDGGKFSRFRIAALKKVQSRCKDFAFSTNLNRKDIHALHKSAVGKGNLEAIAQELVNGIEQMPPAQAKSQLASLIASNDPNALFVISGALGSNGPFEASAGGEVGTNDSAYAWQLVACDHGLDCSASSPVVTQACLGIGLCGPGDYRTNIQYSAVSPADFAGITQAELHINAALAAGSVQKLFVDK